MQRRIDLNGDVAIGLVGRAARDQPGACPGGSPRRPLPPARRRCRAKSTSTYCAPASSAIPATGLNALSARWVEEMIWFYRRTFDAPALAPGERAWLVFDRLELAAVVWLNGEEVGRHANAFYPCRIDVTDRLHAGENVLLVGVEAGLFHASERPSEGYGMHYDCKLTKRVWLRQVQSSFEWDWSTRLLNVGITGGVALEIASGVQLRPARRPGWGKR